ncbi:hypothetical protein [Bradyrhizobium sp. CCBAU 65884]|uniref:hypothetical protein n=1 Tax=Bradyrhizobium sp. CCBAU 65884 TaxID=722477 RepID=UPI002305C26D|nr:hypothetical protein [Bradyrhizobium sp. CCBAU 65884]
MAGTNLMFGLVTASQIASWQVPNRNCRLEYDCDQIEWAIQGFSVAASRRPRLRLTADEVHCDGMAVVIIEIH